MHVALNTETNILCAWNARVHTTGVILIQVTFFLAVKFEIRKIYPKGNCFQSIFQVPLPSSVEGNKYYW